MRHVYPESYLFIWLFSKDWLYILHRNIWIFIYIFVNVKNRNKIWSKNVDQNWNFKFIIYFIHVFLGTSWPFLFLAFLTKGNTIIQNIS